MLGIRTSQRTTDRRQPCAPGRRGAGPPGSRDSNASRTSSVPGPRPRGRPRARTTAPGSTSAHQVARHGDPDESEPRTSSGATPRAAMTDSATAPAPAARAPALRGSGPAVCPAASAPPPGGARRRRGAAPGTSARPRSPVARRRARAFLRVRAEPCVQEVFRALWAVGDGVEARLAARGSSATTAATAVAAAARSAVGEEARGGPAGRVERRAVTSAPPRSSRARRGRRARMPAPSRRRGSATTTALPARLTVGRPGGGGHGPVGVERMGPVWRAVGARRAAAVCAGRPREAGEIAARARAAAGTPTTPATRRRRHAASHRAKSARHPLVGGDGTAIVDT